jgi:enoyl-CoA hydratase
MTRKRELPLWWKKENLFLRGIELSDHGIVIEKNPEGWAILTLSRPEKFNTLSIAMRQTLEGEIAELAFDPDTHVLILTGAAKFFTAGLDLDEWESSVGQSAAAFKHDFVATLRKFPGPIIAAVNGPAITGGLEIVLACDFVVASHEAKFADTHVHVGLLPGWGGSVRMIERVGLARAKELAFTGQFFSAEDAYRWGLVNHLVQHDDLLPFCQNLARQMLKADPTHLKTYKSLLDQEAHLILSSALAHEQEKAKEVNLHSSLSQIKNRLKRFTQSKK